MFARYSRTTKSLRRLFLDEFAQDIVAGDARSRPSRRRRPPASTSGCSSSTATTRWRSSAACTSRASRRRSCWRRRSSGAGSPPTSSSRRGTCATTTGPADGGARPCRPSWPAPPLAERLRRAASTSCSRIYGRLYEPIEPYFRERFPQRPEDSDFIYRQSIMAKTCDTLRVLLPAGTRSNLGIYATGQSYEQLLMRLARAPARRDARLRRADADRAPQGDPGVPQAGRRRRARRRVGRVLAGGPRAHARTSPRSSSATSSPSPGRWSTWSTMIPRRELKVTAAVLYAASRPARRPAARVGRGLMTAEQRADVAGGVGRRAREPSAQARPRVGAHRATGSTCSATTARSATCSATGPSRSSGSG